MSCGLGRMARVLLVDDDAALTAALGERLRAHFQVATAGGGVAALALLRGGRAFDVVVADMGMPGMCGAELLRCVRAEFPTAARLMLTGDQSSATARRAINDGAVTRLLGKPCAALDVIAAIDAALAQAATEQIARDAVEQAIEQRARANATLSVALQLGSPLAAVLESVAALRAAGDGAAITAASHSLDRRLRRLGALFDRFLSLLHEVGDGPEAGACCLTGRSSPSSDSR